jgi:riboflavin biosynthesis pyrimidine reductase
MPGNPKQASEGREPALKRLVPPGEPTTVERLVAELDIAERAAARRGRPYTLLNMIGTADGRATLEGRSGAIGGEADKALFLELRTAVDGVLVGAGTVRAERYGRLVRDERRRRTRRKRGLVEEPLACVVSGRLAVGADIPLLADPQARVAILTSSAASLAGDCRAEVEYVRATREGMLDLPAALSVLYERYGMRTLLCEGGPHLAAQLVAEGLLDELLLSLAPRLGGGDATSETLRILSGPQLDPPARLALVSALEHDSYLFLRYALKRS